MKMIVKIAMQASEGVRSLHQENIIHRDLACRNLLVDENFDVYVSDFGFARQKENKNSKGFTTTHVGPIKWEAPESLQRKEYSEKTDAFSFGVCLYELVCGKEPWEGETHAQVAYQVRSEMPVRCQCCLSDRNMWPGRLSAVTVWPSR
jgi:serine/threonine protein kinase